MHKCPYVRYVGRCYYCLVVWSLRKGTECRQGACGKADKEQLQSPMEPPKRHYKQSHKNPQN